MNFRSQRKRDKGVGSSRISEERKRERKRRSQLPMGFRTVGEGERNHHRTSCGTRELLPREKGKKKEGERLQAGQQLLLFVISYWETVTEGGGGARHFLRHSVLLPSIGRREEKEERRASR